jgi:hypothetical protein
MVRHVISWCAMTCAYGNTGVRTFSVYAVLSTAARLWAAAVPSGNAGAIPRSREGCGRRSNIRSDWRECRARRGNQRGVGAIGGAIRRGTARSSGYCY